MLLEFALIVGVILLVGVGIRIVPEGSRLVVFRFGKASQVLAPGLHFVLPLVDRVAQVPLDSTLADWQGLSEHEISEQLLKLARGGALQP